MADATDDPQPGDEDGVVSHRDDEPPGMPRWVKVFGIVVAAVVLLVVIVQVAGIGGEHGPGLHGPGG